MSGFDKFHSRRKFLKASAATAVFSIVPSHVLGGKGKTAPSDKFTFAQIGVGGRGKHNRNQMLAADAKLVGFSDVCDVRAARAYREHKDVPRWKDYREMLAKLGDKVDGIVISTPDHTHAVAAMASIKAGKHVYCEKPLARTIFECRALTQAARKHGVVTQMGNQGHSKSSLKQTIEFINAGAIGKIKEVHCWTDRSGGGNKQWWPQGMKKLPKPGKIPAALDWDLWLGPREFTPYSEAYMPIQYLPDGSHRQVVGPWRGWWNFGCGAMGDMACHNMDPAFAALELGAPTKIKVTASGPAGVAYPKWAIVEYTFTAGKNHAPVKVYWYEGGKLPERPAGMLDKYKFRENGTMFVGDKGVMLGGSHASPSRIVAGPNVKGYKRPKKFLVRSEGHYVEWIKAAQNQPHSKTGKVMTPGSNFDYAGPLTEAILAGCIAMRFPGKELNYDAKKMRFSNFPQANKYFKYDYRKGWSL